MLFEFIDCIRCEITNRFDQPSFIFIQNVEEILIDAANGKEVQIPPALIECYRNDLDFDRLGQQLRSLHDLCSHYRKVTNVDSITQALVESDNRVIRAMLSEVRKMLQLYFTAPVTSSTSERSFSALRQIKNILTKHNDTGEIKSVYVMLLHSNRTDAIDFFKTAKEFASANDKRIRYFGTFSS